MLRRPHFPGIVFVALALAAMCVMLLAFAANASVTLSPAPPTSPPHSGETFTSPLSSAVTLTGDGTACTTPGGAHCTIVLAQTDISKWDDWTVYLNVSGAATITNVLLEVSPDGTHWTELVPRALDGLTTGTTHTISVTGHYRYLRVEARAASTSGLKVAMSGARI